MKFKSDIEVQAGLRDGSDDIGTAGQILSSTGSLTNWIDQGTIISAASKLVVIACKNTSGATITKGTPVYQTGTVGATDVIEIAEADALISLGKQPAIGLLQTDLNNNDFGNVVITGELLNFTTDPIDGLTPTTGDKVFLKSGGGLTLTKPTGAVNGIQNLGLIGKVSGGNAGSITVSSIMRTNDVPNLTTGKIWVGDGNTIESSVVFLDEPNGRMGIGTTSPENKLHVQQSALYTGIQTTAGIRVKSDGGSAIGNYHGTIALSRGTGSVAISAVQEAADSDVMGMAFFTHPSATGGDAAVEQMRIDQNGNVGIGTISPSEKLDIDGSVNIDGTLFVNTNNNHIRLIDTDNTGNFSVGVNSNFQIRDITANTTPLIIRAGTPDNTILTTTSGRVGIGLSSPSTTLHVGGFTRINGGLQMNTANATIYQILDSALRFGTNNTERMRITNTGQVGIGITAITASVNADDLQIGNGTGGNRGLTVTAQSNSGAAIYFGDADNTNMGSVRYDNSNDSMKFFTNTSEQMRITSTGNVGIGTTSPASKLSVGGNVITTKKPTVVIADEVAGGSLVIRGLSPILSFDRTGANPQNKILMDTAGLEFKTGTLDAEGDVDFKINPNGDLQLSKGAKISNQENTDIDSVAAEVVAQVSTTYTAAFFDFVIKKTTNVRSGTVYACHDGTNVEFTETSTNDLGDTSDVTLSVDISGTNMRLLATVTSDDWSVKSLIRAI